MTRLIYGSLTETQAGYAPAVQIVSSWKAGKMQKMWRLGPRIISAQLDRKYGAGVWKALERFPLVAPLPQLDALESAGIDHPSSWGDTFHQKHGYALRVRYTFNGMFEWWSGGPWSEALKRGKFAGRWFRYDLISAYRWAATLGLPDPSGYRATTRYNGQPGLWVGYVQTRDDLPPVWRTAKPVVFSTDDIEAYNLRVTVLRGVTWRSEVPRDYVERTLRQLPFPKEAGRAYWGRWVARDPLICQTRKTEWQLRNIFQHFIWGWLIVHRVRQRIWEASREAAHVYVDEVVIPHQLPTGKNVGDWHLKETYDNGIIVKRTGQYGGIGAPATMQTGIRA